MISEWKVDRALSILVAVCVALFSSRLPAQAAVVQSTSYSCADTTSRVLGFLVGEYTASAEFRTGPTTWDSTTATVTIGRDLDGCVLREHFRGTRYGAPYAYLALWSATVLRSESRRSEDGRATWFLTQRIRYARRAAGT